MFDGHFRANAEQRLRPVGAQLERTGLRADHLTALGVLMALGASVAIGAGALRAGLLLLILTALPDVLDGAVAKASGTASPRGAFFDSVADRLTDALLLGGVAWFLATTHPGRVAVLPLAVLAASMLVSYERAKAESLGFDARAGSWSGPSGSSSSASASCSVTPHRRAVGDVGAHRVHRRATLRQGVAAAAVGAPPGRPSRRRVLRARPKSRRPPSDRQRLAEPVAARPPSG